MNTIAIAALPLYSLEYLDEMIEKYSLHGFDYNNDESTHDELFGVCDVTTDENMLSL